MTYAHVFQSGDGQAVRLPEGFRLTVKEVEIFRQGNDIVLREPVPSATAIFDAIAGMPGDFMAEGREDEPPGSRPR